MPCASRRRRSWLPSAMRSAVGPLAAGSGTGGPAGLEVGAGSCCGSGLDIGAPAGVVTAQCRTTAPGSLRPGRTGSDSAPGSATSCRICRSTATSRVAVAGGSPEPVLRANRGWAPPDTWSRSRCPAANRYAVALIGTVTASILCGPRLLRFPWLRRVPRLRRAAGAAGRCRMMPSQTFRERPRGSTSHSRAKTSKWPPEARTRTRALTGPTTSSAAVSGALVNTRTSGRASRARLSAGPGLAGEQLAAHRRRGSAGS